MNTKLLTIFAAVVAVTVSYPVVKTWTLNELSYVLGNKHKPADPVMKPYYATALNTIMFALFTATNEESVMALAISPSGDKKWTIDELRQGLRDPALNITLQPYIFSAYNYLLNRKTETEVEVPVPAQDISTWTLPDILEMMENPDTNPALMPYLKKVKNDISKALENGVVKENVSMVTPVGLVPVKSGKPRLIPRPYE